MFVSDAKTAVTSRDIRVMYRLPLLFKVQLLPPLSLLFPSSIHHLLTAVLQARSFIPPLPSTAMMTLIPPLPSSAMISTIICHAQEAFVFYVHALTYMDKFASYYVVSSLGLQASWDRRIHSKSHFFPFALLSSCKGTGFCTHSVAIRLCESGVSRSHVERTLRGIEENCGDRS